jgi:cytidine deaminase
MHNDVPEDGEALSFTAWRVRDNAMAVRTKVGAAVLARRENGSHAIFGGCNIEDLWKASSIHAERTAIACMVAGGCKRIEKILVASAGEFVTDQIVPRYNQRWSAFVDEPLQAVLPGSIEIQS